MIASIGTFSGPVGAATAPIASGVQLWVKHINQSGGLQGHPVRLFVYDDAGDQSKSDSQYRDAVESKRVIAFLSIVGGITRTPVAYIDSKRIPVIGSGGADVGFYDSPMYFPQASVGEPFFFTWIAALADQVLNQGKAKFGLAYCTESETGCGVAARIAKAYARKLGLNPVYEARVSLAQPDYTAECLAARNAGAEVLMLVIDGNSIGRFATSCARQNYRPVYGSGGPLVLERYKDDPNLEGFVGSAQVFPWFQRGTPATDEYQEAVRAFGGTVVVPGVGGPIGWTAGKVLERAAIALDEPPTPGSILRGLWSIRSDDLGGLTYGLTFEEGKPAPPIACWYNLTVRNGAWVSPDGSRRHCLDFSR